ncbi:hypothetical protein GALL_401450 [mine drainage metagenome]|jgi:hypothetical protein|uniref:Uncharacterized protein n=1 Tax=mine drainage metagenome TaxID=410659 RepID=A0A1J5QDS8_9ZZZZ
MKTSPQTISAPSPKPGPTRYPTRESRARREMGWTVGLDLQYAWGIRPACPHRAALAYIHSSNPNS